MGDLRPHLRLRKLLDERLDAPVWPDGVAPVRFADVDPRRIHALLETAFPGVIAQFEDWHGNLIADTEFDPLLCIPAMSADGQLAGFVQCWTTGFVKDLAVAPAHRGRGLGAAMMWHAFATFASRGLPHVDLKVETGEHIARRLYARLGMIEVPVS